MEFETGKQSQRARRRPQHEPEVTSEYGVNHSSLAGVIQNATDEAKECDAVIELFDPRTGGIVSTRTFHDIVEPRGTKPVSMEWAVTDTSAKISRA